MRSASEVIVEVGPEALRARWAWTPGAAGVVLVIQAGKCLGPSGIAVVSGLRERDLSWLRLPLLTPRQRPWRGERRHMGLFAERVMQGMAWVRAQAYAAQAPIGLFGERQGAALALWLAAQRPADFAALVTCHGRLDLSAEEAGLVQAPTLMMAAALDSPVVRNNQRQLSQLPGQARLELIRGATRSLTQPGARDEVAHLAAAWFDINLRAAARPEAAPAARSTVSRGP